MKIKQSFQISKGAYQIVAQLNGAGYETYVVGGAIRDLLLGHKPKDFDIATAATPEQVCAVFGRRKSRIIGRRFRLVHVFEDGDIYEVSTFRCAPSAGSRHKTAEDDLLRSDNNFGTAKEDVFRRDFTANSLFYDPIAEELSDLTGQGISDIQSGIVRVIGDPLTRFAEDPVRLLRALKLVAQYQFSLDNNTEKALFSSLETLSMVSVSRLSLELEKIMKSIYSDLHLNTFFDFGLLSYFLPEVAKMWGNEPLRSSMKLLYERNCRVDEEEYRDSISVACAAFITPLLENELQQPVIEWTDPRPVVEQCERLLNRIFAPLEIVNRIKQTVAKIVAMQIQLEHCSESDSRNLMRQRSYSHARELWMIRHGVAGDLANLFVWPRGIDRTPKVDFFPTAGKSGKRQKKLFNEKRSPRRKKFSQENE